MAQAVDSVDPEVAEDRIASHADLAKGCEQDGMMVVGRARKGYTRQPITTE